MNDKLLELHIPVPSHSSRSVISEFIVKTNYNEFTNVYPIQTLGELNNFLQRIVIKKSVKISQTAVTYQENCILFNISNFYIDVFLSIKFSYICNFVRRDRHFLMAQGGIIVKFDPDSIYYYFSLYSRLNKNNYLGILIFLILHSKLMFT